MNIFDSYFLHKKLNFFINIQIYSKKRHEYNINIHN